MPDYSRGKIYKIEPVCEHEEHEIYIGSTSLKYLCERMAHHKRDFNKRDVSKKSSSYELFDKYGCENCVITLIENVNASTKEELLQKERYYIQSMKCINKSVPLRTLKEYRENNKEKIKEKKSEKITCECGLIICRDGLARHKRSLFHLHNSS